MELCPPNPLSLSYQEPINQPYSTTQHTYQQQHHWIPLLIPLHTLAFEPSIYVIYGITLAYRQMLLGHTMDLLGTAINYVPTEGGALPIRFIH